MVAMKHFISNEHAKARTLKRGGGRRVFSLDFDSAETQYTIEPADETTPEQVYERQWALTLLDQVLTGVQAEYEKKGKARAFDLLKHCLTGQFDAPDYGNLAEQLVKAGIG